MWVPTLSITGSPPLSVLSLLALGQVAWSRDLKLTSQSMYILEPKEYLTITNSDSTWVFGVQYPETLVKWTDEERESAVWATIRKYGPPASEKLYPPGAVPKNGQYALPNYPTDLPGTITIPHVGCM